MTCDRPFHDQVPALLQAMDAEGRLTAVTDRWLAWLGYERSQVMGKPWQDFLTAAARSRVVTKAPGDCGSDPDRPLLFATAQGQAVAAQVTVSKLPAAAGQSATWVAHVTVPPSSVGQPSPQAIEARFQLITETIRDVFWINDVSTRRSIYNSPQFETLWELPQAAIAADVTALLARVHPDDRAVFTQYLEEQFTNLQPSEIEFRIQIPSTAEVKWLSQRGFPVLNAAGQPEQVVGVTRDITAQKQVEAALARSQQVLNTIAETVEDYLWIDSVAEGRPLYDSPKLASIWGIQETNLDTLDPLLKVIHPDDRPAFEQFLAIRPEQTKASEVAFRIQHPQKGWRWLRSRGFPLLDANGTPELVVGFTSDITQQKQADTALRQSEERFRLLADNLTDVFWLSDIQTGENLYVNPAFETLWQLPRSCLTENPQAFMQRLHPDDRERVLPQVMACRAQGEDFDLEYRLRLSDGTVRWVRDRGFIILDATGQPAKMAGIATDITASKHHEEHLRQYERTIAAIPDALCLLGRDYRYRLSNAAYRDWFNQGADLQGVHLIDLFGEDFFETVAKPRLDAALTGDAQFFEECLFNPSQTIERFISIAYVPYTEADGDISGVITCVRDLTTLKQARDRLGQMAQRLQLHIRNSPLAVIEWNAAQQVELWSPQATNFFGGAEAEMIGRHVSELPIFAVGEATLWTAHIDDLLQQQTQQPIVITRNIHRDGQELFCEWYNSVLRDANGTVISILSLVQNITERRQAKLALQASEERWQLAIQGSNEGIWDWHIAADRVFYSPRWKEQLGYVDDELPRDRTVWRSRVHPDDIERIEALMQAHFCGQTPTYQAEYRIRHRSGHYIWILSRGQAVFNAAGEPMRFVGSHVDISDRKQAELDLQASQQLLQMVFDHLPQRVFWKALDGRFLGCNQVFANDMGYDSPKDIIGKTDGQLQALSSASIALFEARDRAVIDADQTIAFEQQPQLYANGKKRWVSTTKSPFKTPEGEVIGIFGCYEDVTAQVLAQRSLRRYAHMVEAANDAMCLLDSEYRYQVINETYRHWYGYQGQPILGQTVAEVLGQTAFENRLKPLLERCLQGETIQYDRWFEFPPLGRRFRSVTLTPYRGDGSAITGIVTSIRDLTSLKESELQQQQLLEVIEATPDFVGMAKPTGEVIYVNPALQRVIAATSRPEQGDRYHIRGLHPSWATDRLLADAIPTAIAQGTWQGETALLGANGAEIPILQTVTAHRNDEGEVQLLSTIARDHRPQKALEQELRDRLTFERLLSRLSTEFVNLPSGRQQLAAGMQKALKAIGQATGAQRSYVYLISPDGVQSQLYSQWHADSVEPIPAAWQQVATCQFPWWMQQLQQQSVMTIDDITHLPPEAVHERQAMATMGTRSLAVVPMYHNQRLLGHIGFALTQAKTWSENEIALLQIVGDLFANAYQRQQAESALRQQEHYYRRLTENASDIVMLLDRLGQIQYVTPSVTRLLNYDADDILGRSVRRLVAPADWPVIAAVRAAAIAQPGLPQPVFQCRVRHQSEPQWRYFEVVASSLLDDPIIQGIVVNCREVSDRVAAETAQRWSERVFQSIFEQSAIGMTQLALDGTYIKVNPAFCQLVGYRADELIGEHYNKITHPDDLAHDLRMMESVIQGEVAAQEIDLRFICADGSVRHVQVVVTAVQGDQTQPAFLTSVYKDVTEQVVAERSLRSVVEGTASVTGEAYFPVLARQLADTLGVDHVFINQLDDDDAKTLNTLVFWSHQRQQADLTYPRANTPCDRTLQQGFYCCPQAVQAAFPNDPDLVALQAESYIGVALTDAEGQTLGEICLLHSQPLQNLDNAVTLLRIFAARASAELERQLAHQALQASEANWRQILENMPILLDAVDETGLLTLWNQECERVTGYSAAEVIGNPRACAAFYPDIKYRQAMLTHWQQQGNNYRNWEWSITCKDGSQRIIAWSNISDLFPIPAIGAWGVGVDVTERRQAEDALRQSEARFQRLAANMPGVIYRYHQYPDGSDRFSYISPGSVDLWEYAPEVICNDARYAWALIHPDDLDALRSSIAEAITQGPTWLYEYRIITPSGQLKWIQTVARGEAQPSGEYTWDGIAVDVTALTQAKAALSASQARFQRLADNTPGVIYRYHHSADGGDRFSYLSAAFREIWELEPEAAIADISLAWNLIHPADQPALKAALSHSAQTLTAVKADYRIITPSGQLKWLQVLARPEREANGDYLWDGLIVDVTEQVTTQKALRESEALNRAILAALPDLLIRMRRDGMCLDMQYPGHFPVVCPKEQHVGRLVQDTLTPEVAAERMQAVERALATGETQIYEYKLPINGALQWEEARVVPMQNDEVLVLVRDIDDRKWAETALRQSEALNRAIVDALPDMFTRISVEGRVLDVHHPAEFPALLPTSKAVGQNLRDFLPTHLADQRIAQVKRAIATQQSEVFEYQLEIDGQLRWEESRIVPFTHDEALVLIRDIDERRRAEEEVRRLNQVLENQNQRLEELVELRTAELLTFMNALPDQIFVVDRTQNAMTFGNQMVTDFAQMTHRQAFEGKTVFECFTPHQAHIYEAQNQQVFQTGEILHIEEAIETSQGLVHLDTYKIPLKRPDGEVYALIGTSRDITELVEIRQALEHQAEQLAATNQELQSFSYSVSHDLRAPLRHINGFIAALKQRLAATTSEPDAKLLHYIEVIENSSQKMSLLIDGLLTLSRVGRREMSTRPVPLGPLVEQAIALLTDRPDKTLEQVEITVDELPTVYGDAALLQQVLSNLIGNAMKFSRDRTPAMIHIGQNADGTCFVRDNGVGFDMAYADKLFSPFQRLHKQEEFQGTGIGLAIVNRIIHRHHGEIWAESTLDQGTTIYFSLPIHSPTTDAQTAGE